MVQYCSNEAIEEITGNYSGNQFNNTDIIRTTLSVSSNLQDKNDIVITRVILIEMSLF